MKAIKSILAAAVIGLCIPTASAEDLTPLFKGFKNGCEHGLAEFEYFKGLTGQNEDGRHVNRNTIQVPSRYKAHFIAPVKTRVLKTKDAYGKNFKQSYTQLRDATFEDLPISEAGIVLAYNNFSPYLVLDVPLEQAQKYLKGKLKKSQVFDEYDESMQAYLSADENSRGTIMTCDFGHL